MTSKLQQQLNYLVCKVTFCEYLNMCMVSQSIWDFRYESKILGTLDHKCECYSFEVRSSFFIGWVTVLSPYKIKLRFPGTNNSNYKKCTFLRKKTLMGRIGKQLKGLVNSKSRLRFESRRTLLHSVSSFKLFGYFIEHWLKNISCLKNRL